MINVIGAKNHMLQNSPQLFLSGSLKMGADVIIVLILCGMGSSVLSALLGVGGGVFMVPILMTVFPTMLIQQVSATSLSIVVGTAIINLAYFIRQKIKVSLRNVLLWSIGMILGVQGGFELSFYVNDMVIIGVFVLAMFLLSIKTFMKYLSQKKGKEVVEASDKDKKRDGYLGIICCAIGGGIAGFTGVGGGSVLAPIITQLKSVKQSEIAVYTNYMMVIGGIGSMYSYLTKYTPNIFEGTIQVGYINFNIVGIMIASSFVMSFVSMRLRNILSPRTSNLLLSIILLIIAIYTLVLRTVL